MVDKKVTDAVLAATGTTQLTPPTRIRDLRIGDTVVTTHIVQAISITASGIRIEYADGWSQTYQPDDGFGEGMVLPTADEG